MRQMMAFQHLESDRLPELDQLFADDASIASWWAREYWIDEHACPDDGSKQRRMYNLHAVVDAPYHRYGIVYEDYLHGSTDSDANNRVEYQPGRACTTDLIEVENSWDANLLRRFEESCERAFQCCAELIRQVLPGFEPRGLLYNSARCTVVRVRMDDGTDGAVQVRRMHDEDVGHLISFQRALSATGGSEHIVPIEEVVSVHHTKTDGKEPKTIALVRMPLLSSAFRRSARNCDECEVNKDALLSLGSDEARFERDVADAIEKALATIHSLGFVQVGAGPEDVYVDSEGRFYLGGLCNVMPLDKGHAGRRFASEYHALEPPSSSATRSIADTAASAAEPHVCFAAFRHVALDGRNPLGADLTKLIVALQELGVSVRHLWAGYIDDFALEVLEGSLDPNEVWQPRNYASDELATFAADVDQNHLDSVVTHCELAGSPWLIEAYGDRVMLVNVPASHFSQMRDVLLRWSDDLVEVGHATASPAV